MAGVITASEPSWIAPFSGLNPRQFGKLVSALRREGADHVRRGRPWRLSLEDRVLLVCRQRRTNLTLQQLAPHFGISTSAAGRIIDHVAPSPALQPRQRSHKNSALVVDGRLVLTRDHAVTEQSKNYRYSTNHQVVIDAGTRLVVSVGQPVPGNRNDCKAWELSGARATVGKTTVIADGGYRGTRLIIPHRREPSTPNSRPGRRSTMTPTARSMPATCSAVSALWRPRHQPVREAGTRKPGDRRNPHRCAQLRPGNPLLQEAEEVNAVVTRGG